VHAAHVVGGGGGGTVGEEGGGHPVTVQHELQLADAGQNVGLTLHPPVAAPLVQAKGAAEPHCIRWHCSAVQLPHIPGAGGVGGEGGVGGGVGDGRGGGGGGSGPPQLPSISRFQGRSPNP